MSNSATPSWLSDDNAGSPSAAAEPSWMSADNIDKPANTSVTSSATMVGVGNTGLPPLETEGETQKQSYAKQAREKTWADFWRNSFSRDKRTILIALLVIVCMNIPFVRWAMYPFDIFATWIHELCHGMAALMLGGSIVKLEIFPDTSGLATTRSSGDRAGFVTSAGYQGTAVIGMLLLMIRRTKRGPRAGTMAMSFMIFISVALWIRNAFGMAIMLLLGVGLAVSAWFLSSDWIRNLYVAISVTCALNACTSVLVLFGTTGKVNGEDQPSDAESMNVGTRLMWGIIWLLLSLLLTFVGFVFAIPGPGESADFALCGRCQDCGCFYLCNVEGKRLWSTFFGKSNQNDDEKSGNDGDNAV